MLAHATSDMGNYFMPAIYLHAKTRVRKRLSHDAVDFQCFWSTGTGWGQFSQRMGGDGVEVTLSVLSGTLPLRQLELGALPKMPTEAAVVQKEAGAVLEAAAPAEEAGAVTEAAVPASDAKPAVQ